jgi:hypothetical protein
LFADHAWQACHPEHIAADLIEFPVLLRWSV